MPVKQVNSQNYWGNTQAHVTTSYRLTGDPVEFLVVSLSEVKANLRITWEDEDALLQSYIAIAESIVQEDLPEVVFREVAMELTLDEFPSEIQIARLPVQSIESVTYFDLDNAEQTLTADEDFHADLNSFPARLWSTADLNRGVRFWPDVKQRPGAVAVAFTAGYASASDVPLCYKQLLHLWVGHLYKNRTPVEQGRPSAVPYTLEYLTQMLRKRRLG